MGCTVDAAQYDALASRNFLRWSYAKAAVLGNYVYVDGGKISQLENGRTNSTVTKLGLYLTTPSGQDKADTVCFRS